MANLRELFGRDGADDFRLINTIMKCVYCKIDTVKIIRG